MKDNRIVKEELLNAEDAKVLTKAIDDNYERYYGKRLKLYRAKARLSQSKLAELSGVNVRMIQYYEQGAKDINKAQAETLFKLAKTLNCSIEDLIEK